MAHRLVNADGTRRSCRMAVTEVPTRRASDPNLSDHYSVGSGATSLKERCLPAVSSIVASASMART
jgi:hypothetical protein